MIINLNIGLYYIFMINAFFELRIYNVLYTYKGWFGFEGFEFQDFRILLF